ncbi:MAG: hypothetical protein ACRDI0_09495 [Actinomycetota bacterium]
MALGVALVGTVVLASIPNRGAPADNTIATLDTSVGAGVGSVITIGTDGLPLIVYLAGPTDRPRRDLKAAHCNDAACTSATITTLAKDVEGPVETQTGPAAEQNPPLSVAIGADGLPLIPYYKGSTADLMAIHCNDVACTSATHARVDTAGNVGRSPSVTIAPEIRTAPDAPPGATPVPAGPVISYYDATNGDLKAALCDDPACAGGNETIVTVDANGDAGRGTTVATGADGIPIIAYLAGPAGNAQLRAAYCAPADGDDPSFCDGPAITDLGPPVQDFAAVTSIVIGSDGLPLIGRFGPFAHCDDVACLSATFTTAGAVPDEECCPPGSAQIPIPQSLTVGVDGLPIFVGQFRAGPTSQGLAHCTDVLCSSATYALVSETNWETPSVTLGADGLPIIAFRGGLQEEGGGVLDGLSVAHCTNEFCLPLFRRR